MDGAVLHVHGLIYVVGAAAVFVQHRFSYWLGVCMYALLVLPGPYRLPAHERVQRALCVFTSGFYFCRMLELRGDPVPGTARSASAPLESRARHRRPLWLKLSHTFLTFMDTTGTYGGDRLRRADRVRACGKVGAASLNILAVVTAATTASALLHADSTDLAIASTVLLWGVCALAGLTAFGDILCGFWMLAAGLRLPELMRNPLMSLSLREFWGQRWNSVIQKALKRHVFLRVTRGRGGGRLRKGAAAGLTFLCSGLIHAYPVFVAHNCSLGAPVLLVLSYFLVQGLATFLQQAVCTPSSRRVRARVCMRCLTVFCVVFPSPVLLTVMMSLPSAPDSARVAHLEERMRSSAFVRTWATTSLVVSVLIAGCAETLLWSGIGSDFLHYREQRREVLAEAGKEE